MAKFRKRPVIIDAEQFTVWDLKKIPPFVEFHGIKFPVYKDDNKQPYVIIPTLEGQHIASNLDYIIKGIEGELYPCKQEIFLKTYEQVI